jgi:hypothetical protein
MVTDSTMQCHDIINATGQQKSKSSFPKKPATVERGLRKKRKALVGFGQAEIQNS